MMNNESPINSRAEEAERARGYATTPDPIEKPMVEPIDIATGRFFNISAIREHALECSKKYRAGKFTRVGEDFIDEVKADTEALIRDLRGRYKTLHPPIEPGEHTTFTTGALGYKIVTEINRAIGRLIQNKVQKQPSVGKTLGRTY